MQALLLYAMFGSMLAALAGVVAFTVDTTQQFIHNQRVMTAKYFRDIEKVLTEVVVPRDMETPAYTTCPDGSTPGGIAAYLCQRHLSQLAQWASSSAGVRDTWGKSIVGYALRRNTPIYASSPNYNVVAPVTAIVLVSSGPDGRVDATLQSRLDALNSGSQLRDVLSIAGTPASTCTPSVATGVSCDDIVYSFSDQRALERRWQAVEGAVERIGSSALRNYQMQFRQFMPQLASIYANNISDLMDADGNLVLTEENVNIWQHQGLTGTPTMANINFADPNDRVRAGVDEEFRYITAPVSSGGSGISLSYVVGSTPNGLNDVLTIRLANDGSPWGTGANKTISFRKDVYATAAP